ncbi:DUF4230 domain-containing protein [Sphingomonas sp. RHCKR47]|uniref:DUF4230 domain-containing protein n=1 Tax=Sphingomonas citricola TaxID=2862498 RepID=UPI001CA54E84|nr:DUF4230 domain-containing protein [Sphingomonas citricola]MBW6523244.1 DUF4230 domain-containing protein [Sphingomonas citricola]
MNNLVKTALGLALSVAIVVVSVAGYRRYTDSYTVATDENGLAVARVVTGKLYGSSDLRVSRLSGIVQATAATSRLWGWLKSTRVVKAPYEVDYFVALQSLSPRDFHYDEANRRLLVEVPDVVVGRPNVDEANVTIDQTSGAFVSRDAMAELQRRVSGTATRVVAAKAHEPQNILKARENGCVALERLFGGTLAAAGLPVSVQVRFQGEPRGGDVTQWDLTRSLEEVLGNGR